MTLPAKPTDAELSILRVLWTLNQATVRQVHESLAATGRDVGYTTILKFLQIMTEKGLVLRDKSHRTHVYRAALKETQTQRQLIRELLHRAFDNSAKALVMQVMSARKASKAELREIRMLIAKMETEAK
jgi:BlaI family transcriptional regulator, penicillinase repressor